MADEAVLKVRLATDEVPTATHSVTKCAQAYMKFARAAASPDVTVEETEALYADAMKLFALLELHVTRCDLVRSRCETEVLHYTATRDSISKRIESTAKAIEELGQELSKERNIRGNKEEYEALAKLIVDIPDRASQAAKREELQAELERLTQERALVEAQLARRNNEFRLLMQCVVDLQRTLEEDPVKPDVQEEEEGAVADAPPRGKDADGDLAM